MQLKLSQSLIFSTARRAFGMAGTNAIQAKPPQPHNHTHTVLIWFLLLKSDCPGAFGIDGDVHCRRTRYFSLLEDQQQPLEHLQQPRMYFPKRRRNKSSPQQREWALSPTYHHAGRTDSLSPTITMPVQWQSIQTALVFCTLVDDRIDPSQAHYTEHVSFTSLANPARRTNMWDTPGSHFSETPANQLSVHYATTCDTITRKLNKLIALQ